MRFCIHGWKSVDVPSSVLEAAVADHPSEPQDREAVAGRLGIREGGHDRVRRKSQGSRTGLAREGRAGGKSPRGKRDPD